MISRILDRIGRYRKVILIALGCAIAGVVAFGLFYPEGTTYLKRVAEKPVFIYRTTGEQTCEGCHRTLDPGIDVAWRNSVHYAAIARTVTAKITKPFLRPRVKCQLGSAGNVTHRLSMTTLVARTRERKWPHCRMPGLSRSHRRCRKRGA